MWRVWNSDYGTFVCAMRIDVMSYINTPSESMTYCKEDMDSKFGKKHGWQIRGVLLLIHHTTIVLFECDLFTFCILYATPYSAVKRVAASALTRHLFCVRTYSARIL